MLGVGQHKRDLYCEGTGGFRVLDAEVPNSSGSKIQGRQAGLCCIIYVAGFISRGWMVGGHRLELWTFRV
jgi:hypothetical protein